MLDPNQQSFQDVAVGYKWQSRTAKNSVLIINFDEKKSNLLPQFSIPKLF
jgi:hypothetical protein